jgi:hypothetical protein
MRVFAQSLNMGGATIQGPSGFGFSSIGDIVTKAMPTIVAFAGFGMLLMIIAAGFTLLTSAGDAKKMEQGKQQLTMAIVGFLLVVGSVLIVKALGIILGIQEVKQIF